jgi:hypothetical protein
VSWLQSTFPYCVSPNPPDTLLREYRKQKPPWASEMRVIMETYVLTKALQAVAVAGPQLLSERHSLMNYD